LFCPTSNQVHLHIGKNNLTKPHIKLVSLVWFPQPEMPCMTLVAEEYIFEN
jgi:hypothetical protein